MYILLWCGKRGWGVVAGWSLSLLPHPLPRTVILSLALSLPSATSTIWRPWTLFRRIDWDRQLCRLLVWVLLYYELHLLQNNDLTSAPPPNAFPSITATLINGSLRSRVRVFCIKAHIWPPSSEVWSTLATLKSAPEQNVPLTPCRMSAFPSFQDSSSSTISANFTIIEPVRAFLWSGFTNEMRAPPFLDPSSVFKVMSPAPRVLSLSRITFSSNCISSTPVKEESALLEAAPWKRHTWKSLWSAHNDILIPAKDTQNFSQAWPPLKSGNPKIY